MVGISEENLYPKFFQNVLRDAFYRRHRSYRHEYRGFNYAVRRDQAAQAGSAADGFNFKGN